MNTLLMFSALMVAIAAGCGVARGIVGPHRLDRILALDFLGIVMIGGTGIFSAWIKNPLILDLALLMALVSFISAIALSRLPTLKRKILWKRPD